VKVDDGGQTLCFDGKQLQSGYGKLVVSGVCDGWDKAKPVAVIVANHESWVTWGIGLLGIGFFLQFASELAGKIFRW
jgi:hypothetical protein